MTLANACGSLVDQFGIIPGYGWGQATSLIQAAYNAGQCDRYICMYFAVKYGVQRSGAWGSLPSQWQPSWNWNRPANLSGPGNCDTLSGEHQVSTLCGGV